MENHFICIPFAMGRIPRDLQTVIPVEQLRIKGKTCIPGVVLAQGKANCNSIMEICTVPECSVSSGEA